MGLRMGTVMDRPERLDCARQKWHDKGGANVGIYISSGERVGESRGRKAAELWSMETEMVKWGESRTGKVLQDLG